MFSDNASALDWAMMAGAANWATIASLVETCKLNDIEPHAYLTATLQAIVNGHKQSQIDALLPWNYAPKV